MLTHEATQPDEIAYLPEHIWNSTERVDDLVVLLGMMMQMGLPQILDHHIPAHWKQRELSWGAGPP